jgi:hypothetical protein
MGLVAKIGRIVSDPTLHVLPGIRVAIEETGIPNPQWERPRPEPILVRSWPPSLRHPCRLLRPNITLSITVPVALISIKAVQMAPSWRGVSATLRPAFQDNGA